MEKVIAVRIESMRRFWIKPSGIMQKNCGSDTQLSSKGHTITKAVGIEETIPRCPLFGFAEGNSEIGAGDRRIGDGKVKKQ